MHLLLPALIRLFKVDASVDVRRRAINTLTKLIPRVQVGYFFWVVLFPKSLIRLKHYEIQLVMWLGFSNEVFLSLYLHCCLLLISGQWACVISSASSQSRFGWVRYHSQF